MRRIAIILLYIISFFSVIYAQKQTYNWVFGYGSGLTWNTTRDVAVTGLFGTSATTLTGLPSSFTTSISTLEGCFSLSDSNGNLLFYSDGMKIWNRNNVVMPNGSGMTGNNSSAQSGIIVPYPGNTGKFLAVTLGMTRANDLSYSVVDMSLQSGLGDVIVGQKNIRFSGAQGLTGESVTSILHANGEDYWILAIGQQTSSSSYINSWLLTSSGVSTTPVVSSFPYAMSGNGSSGYLKITPDGRHFTWPSFVDNRFFYGDFDNSTGQFSNVKVKTGFSSPYGCEFSPDQNLVYLSTRSGLFVYKADELFTATDPTTVIQKTFTVSDSEVSALQLGSDKRIYWIYPNTNYIRIIDNPNDFDGLKIYQTPTGFFARAGVGLPSFAASWFAAEAKEKSFLCVGNDFKYTVEISMSGPVADQPATLEWDFGDGSTKVNQAIVSGTTTYKQTHNYASTGKYTITIIPYKANGVALASVTLPANVVDCVFQTNRMIRTNLLNTAQQQ